MKILFDLLPVFIFFVVYKLSNIYYATTAAIIAAIIALAFIWIKQRKIDKMILISSSLVIILGSITLYLHNDIFIKWKPTAISWAFSLVFLGSQWLGKKPLIQLTLESMVQKQGSEDFRLPKAIWYRLNLAWGLFYLLLGTLNLIVVYNFSTDAWVNFKLFGVMSLLILFVIAQSIYLAKYLVDPSLSQKKN